MNSDDAKKVPHVTAFTKECEGQWPAEGVTIWASKDLAIVASYNFEDITKAQFIGFTWNKNHYCPIAEWNDWVTLAHRILDVEEARKTQELDEYARLSKAFVA